MAFKPTFQIIHSLSYTHLAIGLFLSFQLHYLHKKRLNSTKDHQRPNHKHLLVSIGLVAVEIGGAWEGSA